MGLMCECNISQWHPRDECSQGSPVLSEHFPSPQILPHPVPSFFPPTHWLRSQGARLHQPCPAIVQIHLSPCRTPGPTKKRTVLYSGSQAHGETQQTQQRVIKEKESWSSCCGLLKCDGLYYGFLSNPRRCH